MDVKPEKKVDELLDYLPEDEKILSSYHIGFYDILTTPERVILLRKFPKSFIEVLYDDIDSLEHLTHMLWGELFRGVVMAGVGLAAYSYNTTGKLSGLLGDILRKYFPELANIVPAEQTILFVEIVLALLGAYHILKFLPSLWGYFRISRKGRAPVMVHTNLTSQIKDLIREIQGHMKEKSKQKEKPIVITAPAAKEEESKDRVYDKVSSSMKDLGDNTIVIITSKSKDHMQVVSSMLKILVEGRKMGGVYISISRPYEYILNGMASVGLESNDIYFVDCISKMAGKAESKEANIVFVENPSSLEEVSMYLDRMLSKVKSKSKFLFLDSIDSLLIYNNDKSVKEFTHYIINKVRLEGTAGIILSIEKKEAEDLIKTLVPMCDSEIKI